MDNWYYVGNFGQLGPLERSDLDDLIRCGAITRETYVWREGFSDWRRAGSVDELSAHFVGSSPAVIPAGSPPPPPQDYASYTPSRYGAPPPAQRRMRSSKSKVLAGVLQFIIPGVGRMYMGHVGIGIAQLLLVAACGIGNLWALIDGIMILVGNNVTDSQGLPMSD